MIQGKTTVLRAAESLAKLALQPSALDARTGSRVIAGSVALGVLGDALFYDAAAGLNVPLWTAALVGIYALAWRGREQRPAAHQLVLFAAALVFAAMVAWRGSPTLQTLNLMACSAA